MDVSEIKKVADRNKLKANAERLREKISKENKNILKLKVAQDTAYWDLKQKLRQVEANHEKLQANMVEVQMQHETISGQYQDELRLRPETLNKLSSTRQICDVLEEHCERLGNTLSRCSADRAALDEAYQRSWKVVQDMKAKQLKAEEKNALVVQGLQQEIKLNTEHNAQMAECLQIIKQDKQRTDAELVEVKSHLEAALMKRKELLVAGNELTLELEQKQQELHKKEEAISGLQNDIKRLLHEFNIQGSEMKNTIIKQDKKLKETASEIESLKQALTNQESFTQSFCEKNNQLQEKIAALEEEHGLTCNVVKDLQGQIENATATNNSIKTELEAVTKQNAALEREITEKTELLENSESDVQNLKLQLSVLEAEKLEMIDKLNTTIDATDAMGAKVLEMTTAVQTMEEKMVETERSLTECRETANTTIKELTSAIEEKDKELDNKASTITHLMTEVKSETDARAKLEVTIQKVKREMEMEKEAAGEKERKLSKQVEQLETSVRNKEGELSRNLNVILGLRNEKERLNEIIQSMQNKLDNVQKELIAPPPLKPAAIMPEQDDNAVMFTSTPVPGNKKSPMPGVDNPRPFAVPQMIRAPLDPMVLNFMDDSSMDDENVINQVEVNRRFEALARGERLSPKPLSYFKRRRTDSPTQPRPRSTNNHDSVRRAQEKDGHQIVKDRMFFKSKRQDKLKKSKH